MKGYIGATVISDGVEGKIVDVDALSNGEKCTVGQNHITLRLEKQTTNL